MSETLASLVEQRFGLPTELGAAMPATGTLAVQIGQRSTRRYRDQPVSDEVLGLAFAAALSAPSKSDLQQASIIDVRDPGLREAVQALVPAMPWIAQAPVLLVFCGDNRRIRRVAELRGKPFPNDTLDMFMNAAVDAALVMQSFIIGAQAQGLGTCPLSLLRNQVERLGELLMLPAGVFPVAGLTVGYPSDDGRVSLRLPVSALVHRDRYDGSRFESELAAYDERRMKREPTAPEKQKYRERWGTAAVYPWSEDKARQYSVPERHSFGPWVRAQGFGLG